MFNPASLPAPRLGQKTLYVLKQVLHDWSDTDSLAILKAIRAVISDEVRAETDRINKLTYDLDL